MSGASHMVERHCAFTISKSWDQMNRISCDFSVHLLQKWHGIVVVTEVVCFCHLWFTKPALLWTTNTHSLSGYISMDSATAILFSFQCFPICFQFLGITFQLTHYGNDSNYHDLALAQTNYYRYHTIRPFDTRLFHLNFCPPTVCLYTTIRSTN